MSIDARAQGLLALVASDRDMRRDAILADARQRAAAMRSAAQKQARSKMREAFLDERRQDAERVQAARARLQTALRLAAQARANALLAESWQRLPAALSTCWQDRSKRSAWVAGSVQAARRLLPGSAWQVAHAPDWPEAEQRSSAAAIRAAGVEARFEADAGITAGIRIRAGHAVIDATLDGLLADRAAIEARLLLSLESLR